MGTDIHTIAQAKDPQGNWYDVETELTDNRDYFLFAWLANVRNGFGFAGVRTFNPIVPISPPRGIPADFEVTDDNHITTLGAIGPRRRGWYKDEAKDGQVAYWLGSHSHSWLTFDEVLNAKLPQTTKTGVITMDDFRKWNRKTEPDRYSGAICGPSVVIDFPHEVTEDTTHVKVTWQENGSNVQYFVDEIRRLKEKHGQGRIVFGFDS